MGYRTFRLPLAGTSRLSDVYGAGVGVVDPRLNIPYRQLRLVPEAGSSGVRLGDSSLVSPPPPSGASNAYSQRVIADGASAYWRLGETSGTTAVDVVGGHTGTISGGVILGQTGALTDGNKAMRFNGTSGQIVASPISGLTAITIEAWVNHYGVAWATGYELILAVDSTGGNGTYLTVGNGAIVAGLATAADGSLVRSSTAIPTTGWHHVAIAWAAADHTLRFYLDGVQTGLDSSVILTPPILSGANATLAAYVGGGLWWNGGLDEVAIYPTALTADQIAAHYALSQYTVGSYPDRVVSDGASAYWRLGETSGTTAVDVIGGNNGTISGGVTLNQAGALTDGNKAMRFDGTSGKIVTVAALTLPISCTLEVWIKLTAASASVGFLSNRFTVQNGIVMMAITSDGVSIFVDSYQTSNNVIGCTPPPYMNDGAWHHIVWTTNGTTGTIYIDGVQRVQAAQPHVALTEKFQFAYDTFQNSYFNGLIDEVAIYPTALSAAQIANHYAAALGGPGLPLAATVPLTLGPFAAGPLTLADLYASGNGALLITGVPF